MSTVLILGAMDLAIAAMKYGPAAMKAYEEWRADLTQMQKEGREPTMADLNKYKLRIEAARKQLRSED